MTSRFQATTSQPGRRNRISKLAPLGASEGHARPAGPSASHRASVGPKTQRSSKTTHKLVVLPSAPQTKPLLADLENDLTFGYEIDEGVREYKSQAERMSKDQRKDAGFKRITVYCIAESFKMKLLSSFLKREHNVSPRAFDEALYVVSTSESPRHFFIHQIIIDVSFTVASGIWSQRQHTVFSTYCDNHW